MIPAIDGRYLPPRVGQAPRDLLAWGRYLALHEAIRLPLIGAHRLTSLVARVATRRTVPERNVQLERAARERYWELLARDFENARRGLYPRQLLFDVPLAGFAQSLPRFIFDAPRILGRIEARDHADLPRDVDLSAYPAYYRRNFHWQTDGYFSSHSAALYDLGVELLFIGVGDVMRRQALAEVKRRKPAGPVRLLDVATGTGRFLGQAARALPGSALTGIDLSPWYVAHAREQLESMVSPTPPRVDVANAEALPFADESFDVVTSVFLLHELPRRVRRTVLREMRRVLAPGGLIVIEDAAQPSDARELVPALEQFSKDLHEPFFADYQDDDLGALLDELGFGSVQVGSHFVAKVASATKSPVQTKRSQAGAMTAGGAADDASDSSDRSSEGVTAGARGPGGQGTVCRPGLERGRGGSHDPGPECGLTGRLEHDCDARRDESLAPGAEELLH